MLAVGPEIKHDLLLLTTLLKTLRVCRFLCYVSRVDMIANVM